MVDQDRQCRPALADELLGDEVFRQGAQNQVFPVQADGFFMQTSGSRHMELRRLFGKIFQRRQGPLCRLHFVQDQKRPPGQNPLARHSFQVREEMGRVCISVKAGRRPAVRFQIEIDNGIVTGFSELPQDREQLWPECRKGAIMGRKFGNRKATHHII